MRTQLLNARAPWRSLVFAATIALSGCDAVNDVVDEIDDIGSDAEVHYYLALGDSLAVGVQPNSSGVLLPTDNGYVDALYAAIKPAFESAGTQPRELRLVKLGCPGETVNDMVGGGSCVYFAGSQLDAAVDFLNDNSGRVHLVTIDIGANDFRDGNCITETAVDQDCANGVSAQIAMDLAPVLAALDGAAGPDTTIAGMNYYNPYLAAWLLGPDGQTLAVESAQAVGVLNDFLNNTYQTAGMPVADVATAFVSDDFGTMVMSSQPPPNEMLPVSVNNICEFTYMCDPDPVGPDIHANTAGYAAIADAFEAVLP